MCGGDGRVEESGGDGRVEESDGDGRVEESDGDGRVEESVVVMGGWRSVLACVKCAV